MRRARRKGLTLTLTLPPPMKRLGTSATRFALAALLLLALPLSAIAYQTYRIDTGTQITLPLEIRSIDEEALIPKMSLATPLNAIDLSLVAGANNFRTGQHVFVYLSPGPYNIWYPYTLARRKPEAGCDVTMCMILNGKVTGLDGQILKISYNYEDYVPAPAVLEKYKSSISSTKQITLAVGRDGIATVRALHLGGETISQRRIDMRALSDLTQNGAITAPKT